MTPSPSPLQLVTADPLDDIEAARASGLPLPVLLGSVTAEPCSWLVEGVLPAAEPTLLAGEGGSGKTSVLLHLCGAVATGSPAFGAFPVTQPGPVLVISNEDSAAFLRNRLEAHARGMGWDVAMLGKLVHVLALESAVLDDARWQVHIEAYAHGIGARLVAVDPWADSIAGNENDPSAARVALRLFRVLAGHGIASVIVHHLNKPGPNEARTGLHRVRGASSITNACRAVWTVAALDGGQRLTCEKMSRTKLPATIEVTTAIEEAGPNWLRCRMDAPAAGSWQLCDRRQLSPTEAKALAALDRHKPESVTWTKWGEASGVGKTALSEAIPRLLDLGCITREQTSQRGGKPVFSYSITGVGVAALIPSTPRLRAYSVPTPAESPDSDSATPPPLIGGESGESSERTRKGATPDTTCIDLGPST